MEKTLYKGEFSNEAIYEKLGKISEELKEVRSQETIDKEKEKRLLYKQMVAGLKLSTLNRKYYTFR